MEIGRTILFVCRYNSARSQLAEALARSMAPDGTRILSAGLTRTVVNDEVLRALAEMNLDASAQRSKTLGELASEKIDEVVTLAEEARGPARLAFPDAAHRYWPTPDPVAAGDPPAVVRAVRQVRDELAQRIKNWLEGKTGCR